MEEKLLTKEDERLLKEFKDSVDVEQDIDGNGLGKEEDAHE